MPPSRRRATAASGCSRRELTVASGRYESLVRTLDAGARLHGRRVPEARAADRGGRHIQRRVVAAVREYAAPLKEAGCDTVILGCTHYPLIRPVFQRAFGRDVTLVFSADETAREVAETLARKGFENDGDARGRYRFLTTGDPELFRDARRALPAAAARRRRAVERRRARGGRVTPQRRPRGRTSCGRSSPTRRSSSSRTASSSGRRARRACSARRRSRTACRAGSTARAAAG